MGVFICFYFNTHLIQAQKIIELSEQSSVSLLTCSPDTRDLLTSFGHCAVRVYDSPNKVNYVFHYGAFDFSRKYLVTARLIANRLSAKFEVSDYNEFKLNYSFFERTVHEQLISLKQRQKIFNFLIWNALPENQTYPYDYFSNNCSTKLRDAFITSLGSEIKFEKKFSTSVNTQRSLLQPYLADKVWVGLLFDIFIGLSGDKVLSVEREMFLPYKLKEIFENSKIWQRSAFSTLTIETANSEFKTENLVLPEITRPKLILTLIGCLMVVFSVRDFIVMRVSLAMELLVYSISGLLGLSLLMCWLLFDHEEMGFNFNLFWAIPSNVFILALPLSSSLRSTYFFVAFIVTAMLLAGWTFLPQKLNPLLLPIIFGMGTRYFVSYYIGLKR